MTSDEHVWESPTGWHAAFAFLALVTGAWAVMDGNLALLVPLSVLGCWYAAVGAGALAREQGRRGMVYLAGAWPLTLVLFAQDEVGSLMLFGLYPHIWRLLGFRRALVATVAVISTVTAVLIVKSGTWDALVIAAVTLVIAVLLGWWITRIIEQSRRRAELLAELAATRFKLAAASHDAGVLAERERLGMEIHDTLAQGFTSVLMLVRAAGGSIECDPAAARRQLELAARTAEDNVAESRSMVAVLAPGDSAPARLREAISTMAERLGHESGITAAVVVGGAPRTLPTEHEVALLRIAQEATANVRKHAGASRLTIRLEYGADRVLLEVEDDGSGFEARDVPSDGFGLDGMRRRMSQLGGSLRIRTEPGAGTTVSAEVASP